MQNKIKNFGALFIFYIISNYVFSQNVVDGINYRIITGNTVGVTTKDPVYEGDIVIPSEVTINSQTYSVTEIDAGAFYGRIGVTSVSIPNTITKIGEDAFAQCTGITSFTIPSSVTTIEPKAFQGSRISSIVIPNSVTSLGLNAFNSCEYLQSVTLSSSLSSISDGLFSSCYNLSSITIPNSVTSIGFGSFLGCTALTNLVIPNSVTSIGGRAFEGCTGLTTVTLSNALTSIGIKAFYYCTNITNIALPNTITLIDDEAFLYCNSLNTVQVSFETPLVITQNVFYGLQSSAILYVPSGSKSLYEQAIGWNLFYNVTEQSLTEINETYNLEFCKIEKAYNIQGKEVLLDTKGEVLLLKYTDGSVKKIIQE